MSSRGWMSTGFFLFLVMALLLAACQPRGAAPAIVATGTSALPSTGGPSIVVRDQPSDGNTITIEKVISDSPGWVAIHTVENGAIGSDIGHAHVSPGEQDNVKVNLDPGKATPEMVAMLHIDAGQPEVYEFPGPDAPAPPAAGAESSMVAPHFHITLTQGGTPAPASGTYILEVKDQDISSGVVKISRVVTDKTVWIAIQDDLDGKPGDVIGQRLVQAGDLTDIEVTVDPTHPRSGKLYATLYEDANGDGRFEAPTTNNPNAPDIPLDVNGQPVQTTFTHLGMAAGGTPQAAGHSEATPTPMAMTMGEATPTSGDTTMPGMNPAPGATAPVDITPTPQQPLAPVSFCFAPVTPDQSVTPGIKVADQEIKDGTIHIDDVVSTAPGWAAIWTLPDTGEPKVIGFQSIQAGETQNVSVPVDAGQATARLSAVLQLDAGQPGLFETDTDCIARVGFRTISADFNNLTPAGSAQSTAPAESTAPAQGTAPAASEVRVIIDDQPLRGGDTLVIREAFSDGPGWVGIHLSDASGNVSHTEAIGAAQLKDGLNTNVVVRLNHPERATDKLWGMLHYDRPPLGEYNFPKEPGNDVPVEVNGQGVIDDFQVTSGMQGQPVVIKLAKDSGSSILVDGQGFSLYTPTTGDCTDPVCLKMWRPLLVTGKVDLGDGVTSLKVSVRGLSDGSRQLLYAGLPLYYYVGDNQPGDMNGQLQDNGRWVLAQP